MEIEIGRLIRAVRSHWWLPMLFAVTISLIAVGVNQLRPSEYTATTRMLILPGDLQGLSVTTGSPSMVIDLATSTPVLERVIREMSLDMTVAEFERDILVVQQQGTSLILISVSNTDPVLAADISVAIAEATEARSIDLTLVELQERESDFEFRSNELSGNLSTIDARMTILSNDNNIDDSERSAELAQLQQQRLELAQEKADIDASLRGVRSQISRLAPVVSIVEPARVPEQKDGFSPLIVGIVGGFVGVVVGSGLILWRAATDRSIVNGHHLARITGAPTLREFSPSNAGNEPAMLKRLLDEISRSPGNRIGDISVVAPTRLSDLDLTFNGLDEACEHTFRIANGAAEDAEQYSLALKSAGAIIAAQIGKTTENDVRSTVESLRIVNVPVVGSVLFQER